MDYKSPLEGSYDDCGKSATNYGPRYSPYGTRTQGGEDKRKSLQHQQKYPHSSQSEHSSSSTSQCNPPKYSDRFKRHSYPKALSDLMGALQCKLCDVEVSSPIVAKMHYSGKQHDKKVKLFLTKHGYQVPEKNESEIFRSSKTLADYCEICDVKMTSMNDKLLHYSGKHHNKNLLDPANAKKRSKAISTYDLSHRFGIGSSFSTETIDYMSTNIEDQPFVCELCDVKATTQEQLKMHLLGKKHKDKLEKKNSLVPKPVNPTMSILASVVKDRPRDTIDYSMHRTPSAKPYRCSTCNVSLDTEKLMKMHLAGKRHAKTVLKLEMQDEKYYCDVCDLAFNCSDNLKTHLEGKKHEKMSKRKNMATFDVPDKKIQLVCQNCPFVGNVDDHKCDFSLVKGDLNVENKFVCKPCYNMVFDSAELLEEHKSSRRHVLCLLNQVEGDVVIEELKDWYCILCKKQTQNCKEYTEHLFDISHMSRSTQFNIGSQPDILCDMYKCLICDIMLDKQSFEEHLKDRKHLTLSLQKDTVETLSKLGNEDLEMTSVHCSTCDVIMYNFVQYSAHVLSTRHLNEMVTSQLKRMEK